jgi:hypothetical protein
MFYFKVALIIISYKIKAVCGYFRGIENIVNYIPGAPVPSLIGSLGKNMIPSEENFCNIRKESEESESAEASERADNEKYFTAFT